MKMKSFNATYKTWFFLLIALDTFIGVKMACQSTYQIEKGHNATIGCSPTEVPTEVFWYNGPPSRTKPILVLANDQKSGTLYDDIRFDINLEGKMLISNAHLEDEGNYIVVTYFSLENFHQEQITIQITVRPQQECPKISGCSSCLSCGMRINQTGELICRVSGSRPQLFLQWEISNINGLQFTPKEPISQVGHVFGTWDTYISAEYTVLACGGFAEIRCLSQGDVNLMQRSDSNIEIKADPCPSEDDVADYSSTVLPSASVTSRHFPILPLSTLVIIVGIIVIFIVSMVPVGFCLWKRHQRENSNPLKDALKKYYLKKFNDGVNSTYAACDCVIRTSVEDVEAATSDDIFRELFFNNNDCVIFTGKVGFGKTYLFQQVARLWAKGEILQNIIVIYIKLKPFCKNACILEEAVKSMDGQFQSVEALSSILQERECLLLLDGLSNLTLENSDIKDLGKGNSESHTQSKTNSLSADNYILNNLDNFKKSKVWVTCRQVKATKFSRRYKIVKLNGFNEEQRKTILQQMLKFNGNEFEETKDIGEESRLLSQESSLLESIESSWRNHCVHFKDYNIITKSPLVFRAFASNCLIPEYRTRLQSQTDSTCFIESLLHIDTNNIHLSQTKHFQLLWTLFECCKDEEKSKQIRNIFEGKDLLFTNVNDGEKMSLVKDFCTRYMGENITVSTLTFCDGYPPSLDSCNLPNVEKELTFKNVRLEDKQFISLISRFLTQTLTINFIDSVVPETFSKYQLTSILQTSEGEIKLTVNRKKDDEAFTIHFEGGKWIKSKQDETTSLVQSTDV